MEEQFSWDKHYFCDYCTINYVDSPRCMWKERRKYFYTGSSDTIPIYQIGFSTYSGTGGSVSDLRFLKIHANALSTEPFLPPEHTLGYMNPTMWAFSEGKGDTDVQWSMVPG